MTTYLSQLSSIIQEFPPDIIDYVPSNLKQYSTSPFRYISLNDAKDGKFTVMCPKGEEIITETIYDYTTKKIDNNHLWRYIQVKWGNPIDLCLIQHIVSGKYLCVSKELNIPKCKLYDSKDENTYYLWSVEGNPTRGLFSYQEDTKYFCWIPKGDTEANVQEPMTVNKYNESKKLNPDLRLEMSRPVGNVFLRLDKNKIIMSGAKTNDILKPVGYYEHWGNNVIKFVNDLENSWYPLICRIDTGLCTTPVSQNSGIGLLKNNNPEKNYCYQFNKSRIPLKKRFIDSKSQTKPEQSEFPKIMLGINPSATEGLYINNRSLYQDLQTSFSFWQYTDIILYNASDQGAPPPELLKLKVPTGLDVDYNNINNQSLYDILIGFIGEKGAGIFGIPPRYLIENAHKNGCKIFGCLFLQQNVFGGDWRWWSMLLQDRKIFAEKLIDTAILYGIDGYFLNFESQPNCRAKDTPNTDCSYLSDKCSKEMCQGYWCSYTQGGYNNCAGLSCTNGQFDDNYTHCQSSLGFLTDSDDNGNAAPNYGIGGSDINKEYFIEFLKYFKQYRTQKNVDIKMTMYASFGPGGSSGNYTSGITNYYMDFWIDKETNEPLIDYILSMPASGVIDPTQILYTYSHSQNVKNDIVENYQTQLDEKQRAFNTGKLSHISLKNIKENYSPTGPPGGQLNKLVSTNLLNNLSNNSIKLYNINFSDSGWPKNTGPNDKENICLTSNMTDLCNISEENRKDCMPNYSGDNLEDDCNNKGCCYQESDNAPWCYNKDSDSCSSIICPNNPDDINTCGTLDKNGFISKLRPYDFFVGTSAENGLDSRNFSELWDQYLYCGPQTKDKDYWFNKYGNDVYTNSNAPYFKNCNNYLYAIEKPLSSLFLWNITSCISKGGDTYNDKIKEGYKIFVGKTGLCNKNLEIDPYKNCSSDPDIVGNCGGKEMGLANYVSERSTLNSLPFYTSFCTGNGDLFYINGEPQKYYGSWFDGIQDYLPTWTWWSKQRTIKIFGGKYLESEILSIDHSKAFYGGSCLKIESKIGMLDTEFYLYKTQFDTSKNIKLKITLCGEDNYDSKIMFGYTLASDGNIIDNPPIYYVDLGYISKDWKTKEFIINSQPNNYISSLCLKANKPNDNINYKVYIGKISLEYESYIIHEKPYITKIDSYTQKDSKLTNYNIFWNCKCNEYEYYNIYYGNYFVGRVNANQNPNDKSDLVFNIQNMKKSYNDFKIEGITKSGKKYSISTNYLVNNSIYLFILLFLLIIAVYGIIQKSEIIEKYKVLTYIIIFILSILILIQLFSFFNNIKNMPISNINNNTLGVVNNLMTNNNMVQIEKWSDCKKKAFNINFDDNRPMAWTWLLENLEKMNSPIKVTFFINSSWLNRDLDVYKLWMKKYNVDFQAHGHWHKNHGKDQAFIKDAVCWGDKQTTDLCCNTNDKACLSDEELAKNDRICADLLRKYIYEDEKKELVFAYPFGAYPINDDGNIKPLTAQMFKETYIAARGVQWGQVLEYPDKNIPKSLLGICADYQGQPAGCDNACSVKNVGCNTDLNKLYDDTITAQLAPEYSWPGGIDLNIDYSCGDCNVVEQMNIRKQSLINLLNTDLPVSIMLWGHDFNLTDSNGVVWPCNADFTYGIGKCSDGETSDTCKQNIQAMAQLTQNTAWMNNNITEKYSCPAEMQEKYGSCLVDCVRNATDNNGICTDTNVFKGADGTFDTPGDPWQYFQIQKAKSKDPCTNCIESCWDPSNGAVLLNMLEMAGNRKDLWYAYFVEIVQYLWNRKYTILDEIKYSNNKITCILTSINIMRQYPITVSFISYNKNPQAYIDSQKTKIYQSDIQNKYYIKFIPKDNFKHNIKFIV